MIYRLHDKVDLYIWVSLWSLQCRTEVMIMVFDLVQSMSSLFREVMYYTTVCNIIMHDVELYRTYIRRWTQKLPSISQAKMKQWKLAIICILYIFLCKNACLPTIRIVSIYGQITAFNTRSAARPEGILAAIFEWRHRTQNCYTK